ncbi:hypothetical protein WJX77_011551 [Trebouxia sp. C0004]
MQSHGPISAAVIFAFGWAGLAVVNNVTLKRRPGWDYAELSTFCWVRVVAFACEAASAHHPDRLRNALFEGFYDGAFFLVLVVLYGIFKKWLEEAHNHTYLPFADLSETAKGRIQLGYTILCWLMPIFSALGIGAAAASLSGHSNDRDGGASDALHDTSGAGFLGVLAIYIGAIAVVIVNVARSKMAVTSYCVQELTPLALVAFLLLLKVCFQLACQTYTAAWVNPSLFYPLSALPEILAVIILSWPGLLTIIRHTPLNFGGSATVGPVRNANPAQHMAGYQNGQGGVQSHGEGQPQRPYSQGYAGQPSTHGSHAGAYPQLPYHEHIQQQSYPNGPLHQQERPYQNPPNGALENTGVSLHPQHAQHGSQARQGYPSYPQQPPQAAFQDPYLPSQQPDLPFQQPNRPYEQSRLRHQQAYLPAQPAPADYQQSALFQPYYPNHGHSAPSFFLSQ